MRILYLGNNWLGWQVLEWLVEQGEEIVGLVVHPTGRQTYGEEILSTADLPQERVFSAGDLNSRNRLKEIQSLQPDVGLSVLFGYILRPSVVQILPMGCLNLHPALLPYNRGAHPNVWSIVEGTPAGVTLHYIDEGIDTGDIVAQHQVPTLPTDTGESLHHRLEQAAVKLFREAWPLVRTGRARQMQQDQQNGSHHLVRDVEDLDRIDLEEHYLGRELINILRARTFPPYRGAYFEHDGRRIYLRLQLLEEEDLD